MPKVSIVIPTYGRVDVLDLLFDSLTQQTNKDFEVLVVDQNSDGRLRPIIEKYRDQLPLTHFEVDFIGCSKARNYGFERASGQFVTACDDDCYYDPEIIQAVIDWFGKNPETAMISFPVYDSEGSGKTKFNCPPVPTQMNLLRFIGIEFSWFYNRAQLTQEQVHFDERFGPGTYYPCAEGYKILYELLRRGQIATHIPSPNIYHPIRLISYPYARALGAWMRLHLNEGDPWIILIILQMMVFGRLSRLLRSLLLLRINGIKLQARFLIGAWEGFLFPRLQGQP